MMPTQMTLEHYMALPWQPVTEQGPDGTWKLTVPPLTDFEFYADTQGELLADWVEALRSHLQAYLAVQKVIPLPPFSPPVSESETEDIFTLGWGLEEMVA